MRIGHEIYIIFQKLYSGKSTTQSRFKVEDKEVGTYYAYELQKIIPPEESEEIETEENENESEPEIENEQLEEIPEKEIPPEKPPEPIIRKSTRVRKPSTRLKDYYLDY